jgi:hypothetical protein
MEADIKRFAILGPIIIFGFAILPAHVTLAQQATVTANSPDALPTERIIVTAPKLVPDEVVRDFIKSYAAPSPLIGKIARWREAICPAAVGLPPEYNKLVTQRVRQVAAMVGAPVNEKDTCKVNIDVVFTPKPQALLDDIRTKHPMLLGYHDVAQAEHLATVNHPIQAWYTTQTADQSGAPVIDDPNSNRGVDMFVSPNPLYPHGLMVSLPNAREEHVNLTHLGDGLRSEFFHVIVVIDLNKIAGYQIGALADYTAMLALSQTQSFDTCQELQSITNLMSSGCATDRKVNTITDSDIAYLRALYKMNPELNLASQQGEIAGHMKNILEGH